MALVSACCCPSHPWQPWPPQHKAHHLLPERDVISCRAVRSRFVAEPYAAWKQLEPQGPGEPPLGTKGRGPEGGCVQVQGRGSSGIWGAGLGHQEPQAPVPGLPSDLPPSVSRPSNFRGPHAGRGPGSPFWRACTSHPPPNSVWKDFLAKLSAPHWGVKAPEAHFMSPHHRGQEPWLGTCGRGQQSG